MPTDIGPFVPCIVKPVGESNLRVTLRTLPWRHNGRDSVSNHQPHDCLLNRLFRRRTKKTPKLRVTGLCAGIHRGPVNSPDKWPVTRKMFPFDDVIMKCFTNGLWAHITNLMKMHSARILLWKMWSSPDFAHFTTAQLVRHMQKYLHKANFI